MRRPRRPTTTDKGWDSMGDRPDPTHSALLHELAESLQATGNYLGTVRLHLQGRATADATVEYLIEQSSAQLARADCAFRLLRTDLSLAESASPACADMPARFRDCDVTGRKT